MIIRCGYRKRVSLIIMHVVSDVISYFFPETALGMGFCTGVAEQVWQTRRPPDQCFDWDKIADPLLAGEKSAYCLYRSMPARTSQSGGLWIPENEQILSVVATHSQPPLLGIWWLNTKQNSDRLACVVPSCGSPGDWNHRWPLNFMHANMKWVRILLPCQD